MVVWLSAVPAVVCCCCFDDDVRDDDDDDDDDRDAASGGGGEGTDKHSSKIDPITSTRVQRKGEGVEEGGGKREGVKRVGCEVGLRRWVEKVG